MTTLLDFSNNILLTFQSASDVIKALIITVPPAFVLALSALRIWSRRAIKHTHDERGEILFSTHRNPDGTMTTYRHQGHIMTPFNPPSLANEPVKDAAFLRLVKYAEERDVKSEVDVKDPS